MKKQLIGVLFLICVLMPSVAMADFSLDLSRPEDPFTITSLESITFTLEVREDGSPVSGQSVTFSLSPDDGIASLSTISATTDSNGQAQTTLSLAGNSSESHYKVAVRLDNGQGNAPAEWVPVGDVSDGAELKLYINHLRRYSAGESVGFTASLVKGCCGVSGRTVTFSLSPDDGTASLSTTSGTTNSNGDVRTTLILGSYASGSYSVTATLDDGASASNGIGSVHNPTLQPPDFILSMTIPSGAIPLSPGESRTFIAIAQKDGGYVSGKTVTFSVSPNDGTVSLSTTSATTGSDGRASTSLITGSGSSGSYTVTASGGGHSISGTVTVEASSLPPTDPNPDPEINPIPEVVQIPQEQQTAPEGPTGNADAPEGSTGNTQAQQAAPEGSTGNTQGTPRSVTTNIPTDTEGTPNPDTPEQQASNLVVDSLGVNRDVLNTGESFTLSAVVRNQGEGSSSTGTLTYYQYFDDASVEKVGESEIASLAAGETTDVSLTLTAPETSGTHSYFACIGVNCSSTVKISVGLERKGELVISSGDNQTGTLNKDLPNPISVQVLGEDGKGVPSVKVVFRVVSGRARMRRAGGPKRERGATAWTDSAGYAKAYVTPRSTGFPIKIRASVDGLDSVVFTVNPEQAGGAPSALHQPNVTALLANYPNPFNPETWIPYRLAKASEVVVAIFASNGQVVRRLELGHQSAGIYQSRSRAAYWDGKNEYGEPVASGLYFYTLTAGDFTATRKMLIRK